MYAESSAFIKCFVNKVVPKEGLDASNLENPSMALYRDLIHTYATTFGASADSLHELREETDASFAAARLYAASGFSISDLNFLKKLLDHEDSAVLVKELCGKAEGREVCLTHLPGVVSRCVFYVYDADTKKKPSLSTETEGYVGLRDALQAAVVAARAYVDAEANPNITDALEVNVGSLSAVLRSRAIAAELYKTSKNPTSEHVDAYAGGATLAKVVEAHEISFKKLNLSCAELYLAPKAAAS
jgi:hypothetical protein